MAPCILLALLLLQGSSVRKGALGEGRLRVGGTSWGGTVPTGNRLSLDPREWGTVIGIPALDSGPQLWQ